VHEAVTRSYNQTHEPGHSPYVRLSVENTIDKVRLDDFEKMPQIAASTSTYLATETTGQLLQRAVELGTGSIPIVRRDPSRQGSVFRSASLSPTWQPTMVLPAGYPPQSPPMPSQLFNYPQPNQTPQPPMYPQQPGFAPPGQQSYFNPTDSPTQVQSPQQDKPDTIASPTGV
ncbi:hypothetical protein FRC07_011252, partial [Ceratobasidium sp. 392]